MENVDPKFPDSERAFREEFARRLTDKLVQDLKDALRLHEENKAKLVGKDDEKLWALSFLLADIQFVYYGAAKTVRDTMFPNGIPGEGRVPGQVNIPPPPSGPPPPPQADFSSVWGDLFGPEKK